MLMKYYKNNFDVTYTDESLTIRPGTFIKKFNLGKFRFPIYFLNLPIKLTVLKNEYFVIYFTVLVFLPPKH